MTDPVAGEYGLVRPGRINTTEHSPADVLRAAAQQLADHPRGWGRLWMLNPQTGQRDVLGTIAAVCYPDYGDADPYRLTDAEGQRSLAVAAVAALEQWLVQSEGFGPAFDGDPAPLAGEWNDQCRSVWQVVKGLRAAADWYERRPSAARRALAAWAAELPAAAESAVLPGAVCSGFLLALWALWNTPLAGWLL